MMHSAHITVPARNGRPASEIVMNTMELVIMIIQHIAPDQWSLRPLQRVNTTWRKIVYEQWGNYGATFEEEMKRYRDRPLSINIHLLKRVVFQYPVHTTHEEASPGKNITYRFSCLPRKSMASHAQDSRRIHDLDDFRSSAIIPNVWVKKELPEVLSETDNQNSTQEQLHHHDHSLHSMRPLESLIFNTAASNLPGNPEMGDSTASSHHDASDLEYDAETGEYVRYIPCPYDSLPYGASSDEEMSMPAVKKPRVAKGEQKLRSQVQEQQQPAVSSMDVDTEDYSRPINSIRQEVLDFDFDTPMPPQGTGAWPEPPQTGSSSRKQFRPSRNWTVTIQSYLYMQAAMNAMIVAAREYMENTGEETVCLIEGGDSMRIIWNESKRQLFIWDVTPTMMDRSNPNVVEEDYIPPGGPSVFI
ncbi:hypothetical protein BGZ99_008492 [Dissophora globulifera]|uniref:Uncharacterized protein n=1 Tax=Dissophora globulifera TaxID=979702 RepID=A0A9P6RRE7_9FUNG|nr:hypothetical protein BGZ99_008492 [Dissophora globulifera]